MAYKEGSVARATLSHNRGGWLPIIYPRTQILFTKQILFIFIKGVTQGDGLLAILFIIALHYVIKGIDQQGMILNKPSQIYAYAELDQDNGWLRFTRG